MSPTGAPKPKTSRPRATGLLAFALVLGGVLPAAGEKIEPPTEHQGVLSGPVEGMGKNRKIMPLPKMQIDPATASPDATPAERPMRPFSGWVGPRGCTYPFDGNFLGRLQDGRISGMAGEGVNFDWPVGEDGTFSGRLPLKQHEKSGAQIFQWITGRVEGDQLSIDVEYGAPDRPDTFCRGEGITLKVGG
jgi:hypothetical protein